MTASPEPPRWRGRYRNFTQAFTLFRDAASREPESLNDLERDGLTRRFLFTFRLAWKTLKDRLEHEGVELAIITPRNVLREAFAAGMIDDGQGWINMLEDGNVLAREYDRSAFEAVKSNIHKRHLPLLETLWTRLGEEGTES